MKKLLIIFCMIGGFVQGQIYNMPGGTINTCSGTFYDTGGSAGNYLNGANITQTFCSSTPGQAIQLAFSSFTLESSYDYMYIYDGPNTASPSLGTFSGSTSPGTITGSGSCITIVFTSDGSVVYSGWAATISCVVPPPPSTNYNMPGGTINTCVGNFYDTGGSGSTYGNSQNITTTFCSSTPGQSIQLAFSSFNTESGFDVMTIYDGPNTGSPVIGSYTGSTSPGTVVSSSTCITVVFTSDGSVTYAGWAAAISCVAPPPPSTNYNNPGGTISTCVGNFYDTGGSGGNYTNSQNITTTFCSDTPGLAVQLNFSAFTTESGLDVMTIYNGPNTSSPVLGTYSGGNSPGIVTGSGSCLTIVFVSDGSVVSTGWAAAITCVTPPPTVNMTNGTVNTCSAYFYDNGGSAANYSNNQNLTQTFCSSVAGQAIQLNFSSFTLQSGDQMVIYDGPNTASTVLGTYQATSPGVVTGSGTCLTVVFTSNNSLNAAGWSALVSCAQPAGNVTCPLMNPICSGSPITFTAEASGIPAEPGNDYGCLFTYPNPTWYYLEIDQAGNLVISMNAGADIDYAMWGPYPNLSNAVAACGTLPAPISCSYSASPSETASLPTVTVGQVYILLVTNFANVVQTITVSDGAGNTASTNCAIVLGVTLSEFKADCQDGDVLLNWTTEVERENDYFTIQKSYDGTIWETIGFVDGLGNTEAPTQYQFKDKNSDDRIAFYRLKQVDFNGVFTFTDVVSANCKNQNTAEITVFPVPAKQYCVVKYTGIRNPDLSVIDFSGRVIAVPYTENQSSYHLDLSLLEKGIYSVVLSEDGVSYVRKLIVQ